MEVRVFPISISNAQRPASCLIIQLSSDTIYPEIMTDSTGKGSVPQDYLPSPLQPPVTIPGCHLTGLL